jgi:hypothetical protein
MLYTQKTGKSNVNGENVNMGKEIYIETLSKNSPGEAEKTHVIYQSGSR